MILTVFYFLVFLDTEF